MSQKSLTSPQRSPLGVSPSSRVSEFNSFLLYITSAAPFSIFWALCKFSHCFLCWAALCFQKEAGKGCKKPFGSFDSPLHLFYFLEGTLWRRRWVDRVQVHFCEPCFTECSEAQVCLCLNPVPQKACKIRHISWLFSYPEKCIDFKNHFGFPAITTLFQMDSIFRFTLFPSRNTFRFLYFN